VGLCSAIWQSPQSRSTYHCSTDTKCTWDVVMADVHCRSTRNRGEREMWIWALSKVGAGRGTTGAVDAMMCSETHFSPCRCRESWRLAPSVHFFGYTTACLGGAWAPSSFNSKLFSTPYGPRHASWWPKSHMQRANHEELESILTHVKSYGDTSNTMSARGLTE